MATITETMENTTIEATKLAQDAASRDALSFCAECAKALANNQAAAAKMLEATAKLVTGSTPARAG